MSMQVLRDFSKHCGLSENGPPRQMLESLVAAFARLPYENITKIIRHSELGIPEKARRGPAEVVGDHIAWGTGGTCFSLTFTLRHLVRSLRWEAECILADRAYGQDTHCALLVWINGIPHLLDPGFLIVHPISLLFAGKQHIETGFNKLVLEHDDDKNKIPLSTIRNGSRTYRLTYKTLPVDVGQFFKAWDGSFDWDMMRYPLLTKISGAKQAYLRGSRLQISKSNSVERHDIAVDDLAAKIAAEFKIHPSVIMHALSILKHKGEPHGKTWGS